METYSSSLHQHENSCLKVTKDEFELTDFMIQEMLENPLFNVEENNSQDSSGTIGSCENKMRSEVNPARVNIVAKVPTDSDVLSGRGKGVNNHKGNIRFRDIVRKYKNDFLEAESKKIKTHITAMIVKEIRSLDPPGRFLEPHGMSDLWVEIGDENAMKKTAQALREFAKRKNSNSSLNKFGKRAKIQHYEFMKQKPTNLFSINENEEITTHCINPLVLGALSSEVEAARKISKRSKLNDKKSLVGTTFPMSYNTSTNESKLSRPITEDGELMDLLKTFSTQLEQLKKLSDSSTERKHKCLEYKNKKLATVGEMTYSKKECFLRNRCLNSCCRPQFVVTKEEEMLSEIGKHEIKEIFNHFRHARGPIRPIFNPSA